MHTRLDYSAIKGDGQLGQLSLRTEGIQADNTATVVVHADFIPRNVFEIWLDIDLVDIDEDQMEVVIVPESEGGLIPDWTQATTKAVTTYQFIASGEDPPPLRYADFGSMIELRFQNVTQPFQVRMDVANPLWSDANEAKYFTHPDSISVEYSSHVAPSFPLLFIPELADSQDFVVDLGNGGPLTTPDILTLTNIGGSHIDTGVLLQWFMTFEGGSGFWVPNAFSGTLGSTYLTDPEFYGPFVFNMNPDRSSVLPGVYSIGVVFSYTYGTVNIEGSYPTITMLYTVDDPIMTLTSTSAFFDANTNTIDFGVVPGGTVTMDANLTLANTGQSYFDWSINTTEFPAWLSVTQIGSRLGEDESTPFLVRIFRANLPALPDQGEFDLVITGISADPNAAPFVETVTVRASL